MTEPPLVTPHQPLCMLSLHLECTRYGSKPLHRHSFNTRVRSNQVKN